MYLRFVDDTFSEVDSRRCAEEFLNCGRLHDALTFTIEGENDGQLPFMDVRVRKEEVFLQRQSIGNQRLQGCTQGGTATVPQAKRSHLSVRLHNMPRRSVHLSTLIRR